MIKKQGFSSVTLMVLLNMTSGCALLGKSEPITPRYFSPTVDTPPAQLDSQAEGAMLLRLGRVQAGLNLRERMAYRTSPEEVGYYEDRRWTERPEVYLRRALSRSLFEVHGLRRAVGGVAPTLDAELVRFEEIRGDEHSVKVEVVMTLDDPMRGAIERTMVVEHDVESADRDDPQPVVQALGRALSDVVAQISDQVVERLASMPPSSSAAKAPAESPPVGKTTTTLTTETTPPASP